MGGLSGGAGGGKLSAPRPLLCAQNIPALSSFTSRFTGTEKPADLMRLPPPPPPPPPPPSSLSPCYLSLTLARPCAVKTSVSIDNMLPAIFIKNPRAAQRRRNRFHSLITSDASQLAVFTITPKPKNSTLPAQMFHIKGLPTYQSVPYLPLHSCNSDQKTQNNNSYICRFILYISALL